ncbi:MAG: hypothetical protein MRY72_05365 [Aquisalinus sp.]|nr:hypothetical protein [Aquisalinus sp.]
MINTWEEYAYFGLLFSCFIFAILTADRRIHIGSITVLTAWTASILVREFLDIVPWILSEVIINLAVFYVFLQLHFKQNDEEREPLWPLVVMGLEALIFCSHLAYWIYGYSQYVVTVNIFFGFEVLTIIFISILRIIDRFFVRAVRKSRH